MRKLKLQVQMSIDGFVSGPNGEMDWLVFDWSEDIKKYVEEITKPVDTILLGRNLATGLFHTGLLWRKMTKTRNKTQALFIRRLTK